MPSEHSIILFCVSNSTHVKMWKPVISAMRKKVDQVSIEILSLDTYYSQSPLSLIKNANADRFHILDRKWSSTTFWAVTGFKKLLMLIEGMLRIYLILRKTYPKTVVLGNDIGIFEVMIIKVASRMQIPTVLVQDGILNGNLRRDRNEQVSDKRKAVMSLLKMSGLYRNHIYGHGNTTAMAVMGQYTYDLLQNEGKDMKEVFITGQPRFDEYANIIQSGAGKAGSNEARRKYGIPEDAFVVSFFTQPFISYGLMKPEHWDYIIETVFASVGEAIMNTDCRLVVKLHPAEHLIDFIDRYSKYIDPLGNRVVLDEKIGLNDAIFMADLVIVNSSTVSLEAILFDKPVIMLDPYEFLDDYKFVGMGAAIHAATKEDLLKGILLVMNNSEEVSNMRKARLEAIKHHLMSFDSYASSRTADLILRYLIR